MEAENVQSMLEGVAGGVDGEIFRVTRQARTIGWGQGKPLINDASTGEGVAVRILEEGGMGMATGTSSEPSVIQRLLSQARDTARLAPKDFYRRFTTPARNPASAVPVDSTLFQQGSGAILSRLEHLEKHLLAIDKRLKKVVKLQYGEELSSTSIVNTLGLAVHSEASETSFIVEILAEDAAATEVAWDVRQTRFGTAIDWDRTAAAAAESALQALGGGPMATGRYPVVATPRVAADLLCLVGKALSGEAVQLGRSYFRGLVNTPVASETITVEDDPLMATGVASGPFDDEGVSHKPIVLIENGLLRTFFYDHRSAARDKTESNGRGFRAPWTSAPRPHPTNLFIRPGAKTPEELLAKEKQVFHVKEVMGLHMADPITGEFSLGASGDLYDHGRRQKPVRGVTIAGQMVDLLRNIRAVGNDLAWHGSYGSPSLLISNLSIAGT